MATRMKRLGWAASLALMIGSGSAGADERVPERSLVPLPARIETKAGRFIAGEPVAVVVAGSSNEELSALGELTAQIVHGAWSVPANMQTNGAAQREIVLKLAPNAKADSESYTLDVGSARIDIAAPTTAGLFYGLQTLRQLITPESAKTGIAAVHIEDAPRFKYRGMHLDVGRHLYPVEFIKRYVDLMARYKFNTFHWHLTEDQGWRLEIKRYPKLTEVGAWRKETIWGRNFDPYFGDGVRYGGFYTQEQVRDVVAYARARHVTIIPEIDLPGHMKAALASYPELACTPGPFEVSTIWGVEDDVLCPSETTFRFLEGVLTEVMELFPSRYIHLGGDEAPTKRWKESTLAQEIMRREHYTKEVELQGYFLRRLEKFLATHGRRLIGWDEILAGGLSPQATVMSWRGMDGGTAAAQQGHDVIMSPGEFAYFDHCEGDPERDPICLAGDHLPMRQVYRFEPVPPQLSAAQARHILGGQANQWTEYLPTSETVEYMNFPREFAMAEVLWSPRERRDWTDFQTRLGAQLKELDRLGVRYRIPDVDGLGENTTTLDSHTQLTLHSPLADATIHYTLDGTEPDEHSARYEHPLDLALDTEGTPVAARLILADGRKGPVSRATFRRTVMHPAAGVDAATLKPGLARAYFEHEVSSTRGIAQLRADRRDTANAIGIPADARPESFALTFDGYLRVPADGLYDFRLESDDGAVLRIDGDVVVDRDGPQSLAESGGQIGLAAGLHAISLKYFQDGGGKGLNLRVRYDGTAAQPLAQDALSHQPEKKMKLVLFGAMLMAACAHAAPLTSQALDGTWEFRLAPNDAQAAQHAEATHWHRALVPGNVHTDLLAAAWIPDPYVGAAEAGLQWIGLGQWEYRTTFDVDAATLKRAHADLVFDGLDTFAHVELNGTRLLDANNAFRTWRVPVRGKLRAHNTLCVVFDSPIARLLPQVQAMPHKLAGNYPSPYGDEPKDAMTGNFVRKPGYHYGWDWGPRYVTAGIWRSVKLESWDALRLADFDIRQRALSDAEAQLEARVQIDSDRADSITLDLEVRDPDGKPVPALHQSAELKAGANAVTAPITLVQPQRWWPNGYGRQALYTFSVRVADAHGVQAQTSRRTGLRTLELRRDKDASGQGFAFVVNGVPIFAKGANVIPFDAFPARVPRERVRRVLESARDANMNLLRSWGGGYYESDEFFDLADELGLMIWQDFMFGGGTPPAYDPQFRANVLAEARDNIRRLRNHPSLVLWNGNNEEETAWKDWGIGAQLAKGDPDFARRVWDGYVQLFGRDLRDVVAKEANGVPYWSSSPSNDLAPKANDPDNGDEHYWEVWGGPAKPVEAYLEIAPRFMSEFGLQSWPALRTIATIAKPDDLAIGTPVLRAHQKFMAGDGDSRLMLYVAREYGAPRDFADYVYLSQLMQAEGIELAALHHRASRPRTMGSLYWQLNDVWPGASWSSIDFYGNWKPLQFHARRFFAPLALAALRHDHKTEVTLISDRTTPVAAQWRVSVLDLAGKRLREELHAVTLPALSATHVAAPGDAELLRGADPRHTAASFELWIDGRRISRRIVYFDAAKHLALRDPHLHAELQRDGDGYALTLTSKQLARGTWIDFGAVDAELSDNAFDLPAGETATVRMKSSASLDELRRALTLRSYIPNS